VKGAGIISKLEQKKKRWLPWSPKKEGDREFQELLRRVEQNPDDPRLHQRLAEFYLERGSKNKAVGEFTKAAECHCDAGFYLRAIALYRRILRLQGESTKVLLKLGELYVINGLLGDALVHFQKVIRQYRQNGRAQAIPAALRRMVEVNADSLEVKAKFIELLRSEGFLMEALDELLQLHTEHQQKRAPDLVPWLHEQIESLLPDLRNQYTKLGKQKELRILEGRIKSILQPREEVALSQPLPKHGEEEVIREEEEVVELVELEQKAVEISEIDISRQLQEARFYSEQGLFDEAEALLKTILEVDSGHIEARRWLKSTQQMRQEMMGSEDSPISMGKGDIPIKTSKVPAPTSGAKGVVEGVHEKPPDDARVRFELGMAYRELELIDECIQELLIAVQDRSMAFSCHRELGICFLQKGDMEKASFHLTEAINCPGGTDDEILEVSYELAQILEQQGKAEQALILYQKIGEKDQTFRDVQDRVKSLIQ
jgi:tetratricopeptide (TPR) repeat protein